MSTLAVCCSVFPGVRASGLITGISCPAGPPFLPHAVMFRPGILVFYAPSSSLETFSNFQQKAEKFSPAKFKSAFLRNKMYGAAIYILPALYVCVCICYCIAMWTRKMEMHLKLHLWRCISNLFLFPLALLHANFMQKYVKFSILNDVAAAVLYSYSLLH